MPSLEPTSARRTAWLERIQALAEVFLMAGLLSSLLAALPFSLQGVRSDALFGNARLLSGYIFLETFFTLLLLAFILKLNDQDLKYIGWGWEGWSSNLGIGVGMVPLLFLTNIGVSIAFKHFLPRYYLTHNPLIERIRTEGDLFVFLALALVAGGVKEELQRAFILTRFREHLGGAKTGLIIWSIAFGAGHLMQGLQGSVTAAIFGLFFGAIYLLRGNLLPPMVAHWLYDTVALVGSWTFK